LQSGLRNWAVGADTYAYYEKFERVKLSTWLYIENIVVNYYFFGEGKDPGYEVFQKIIQFILPHYQLYLILIAIIFFSSLGNFIYKNTARISDAVLAYVLYSCLFFGFFSITGHRQTIATAASLYGFELIKRRKLIQFLLLILLASTIHKSVIIFIPFYFIAPLKKTTVYYLGGLIAFPLLMVYKSEFLQILQDIGGYNDFQFYEGAGTYTFTFMLLLIAVIALWRMKTVFWQSEAAKPFYLAFIFALIFTPLTWINPSAMRAVQYFSIFILVLVPAVINSFEVESQELSRMAFVVSICLLIGLFINANIGIEYKFFWQEMTLGENYQ
jgi:transmembrane protein EpsG